MISVLAAGLALLQGTEVPKLADDPKLQLKVAFHERLLPVENLCRDLSKRTGIALRPVRTIAELKVALRIVDRPAGWVLDNVAEVLDLEWRKTSEGYELFQPAEAAKALAETLRAERSRRWDRQRKWLRELATLAQRSRADLKAEMDDLERQIAEFPKGSLINQQASRYFALKTRATEIQKILSPPSYALGRFALGHQALLESMIRGQSLEAASTSPSPGIRGMNWHADERETAQILFFGGNLRDRFYYAAVENGPSGANFDAEEEPRENEAEPPSPSMRYMHWGFSQTQIADALAGRKLADPKLTSWPEHPIFTDLLLASAEFSGLDLIADAFHEPAKLTLPVGESPTQIWQAISRVSFGPYVRVKEGVVQVRHARFWNLRESEIPESALAALNVAKALDRAALYRASAEFAAHLTPAQERRLGDLRYEGWGRQVEFARYALPALKFWGLLSPAEREDALARRPLSVSGLSAAAKTAYRRAILEFVLLGGGGNPESASRLILAALSGELEGLAFLTEATTGPYVAVTTGTRNFILNLANAPEGSEADGMKTDHYFYFGFDAERAIRYSSVTVHPKGN